jgi:hypothetical protein
MGRKINNDWCLTVMETRVKKSNFKSGKISRIDVNQWKIIFRMTSEPRQENQAWRVRVDESKYQILRFLEEAWIFSNF